MSDSLLGAGDPKISKTQQFALKELLVPEMSKKKKTTAFKSNVTLVTRNRQRVFILVDYMDLREKKMGLKISRNDLVEK